MGNDTPVPGGREMPALLVRARDAARTVGGPAQPVALSVDMHLVVDDQVDVALVAGDVGLAQGGEVVEGLGGVFLGAAGELAAQVVDGQAHQQRPLTVGQPRRVAPRPGDELARGGECRMGRRAVARVGLSHAGASYGGSEISGTVPSASHTAAMRRSAARRPWSDSPLPSAEMRSTTRWAVRSSSARRTDRDGCSAARASALVDNWP